jgi:carboxyl-terminal processing protease
VKKFISVVAAVLLVLSSPAFADVVTLKGGDRITGRITEESKDSVTIETEFGRLTIPRPRVQKIKRSDPNREEYLRRVKALIARHKELARWCRENSLEEQAREHLEAADRLKRQQSAPAQRSKDTGLKVFDAAWEAVRDKFYDTENYNGCDWDAIREKYLPLAKEAGTQATLYDVINEMLAELNASHCYLWSPYVWKDHVRIEFRAQKSLQAGIEILKLKDRYFVKGVYDGGPADKAGVKVGDELVSVDGKPAGKSRRVVLKDGISTAQRVLFTLRTDDGESFTLGLLGTEGGKVVKVSVKPAMASMLEAAKNSVKVIERGGKKLGYIHLWHFMNRKMGSVFREALSGKLKDCDGLVLDIRGRGGSPRVIQEVLRAFTRGRWVKPAVLIVDEDTASAKEIFAYHWKKSRLGPVVGRTTAGHVLGSGMIPMPDGSMLLLARVKVTRMTDGKDLEGSGVEPDVKVEQSFKYCAGKDPMVEEALKALIEHIKTRPQEPMFRQHKPLNRAA